MDCYSIIVVADVTAPVRRYELRKDTLRRAIWVASIAAVVLVLGMADYVRVRIAQRELDALRVEVTDQQQQIAAFDRTLEGVREKLDRIDEFERKVRIIANLPGSAGTGGDEVTEFAQDAAPTEGEAIDSKRLVPGLDQLLPVPVGPQANTAVPSGSQQANEARQRRVERLGHHAETRTRSLAELTGQLESKRERLASTPAIWPSDGWLTSRFGARVSPFTQRKQFHAGIDIAGQRGTDIIAPASGKVVFSGERGPLGNSIIIDHGYGVRTLYGHSDELYVGRGDEVERGQRIAALGNSGRSTGPHLHYVVEINGKAVDPLDYIFD